MRGLLRRWLGVSERRGHELEALMQSSYQIGGVSVTPETAMRCSTVYACVRVISESIAQCPCIVYQRIGDARLRAIDHPLYALLHDAPNENQTAFEFFEQIGVSLNMRGNAYVYMNPNASGVRELIPLQPDQVTPRRSTAGVVTYEVRGDSGVTTYSQRQIMHVRALSHDGVIGLSPIQQHRETIGLAMTALDHGTRLFSNGAKPAGILNVKGRLSDDGRKRLRESWQQGYSGDNVYRTAVLEEDVSWTPVTMTSEDAQYLETRKFQRSEICGIFRVPPHKVGDLERATFSNIEQQSLEFLTDSLLPWLRRIEQAINKSLLAGTDYYCEFLVDSMLRADIVSRMNAYATAINNGIMNRNEVRARENMNPYAGGDQFLVPLNMTTGAGGGDGNSE